MRARVGVGKRRDQPKKVPPVGARFPWGWAAKQLLPWQQLSAFCFLPQNGVTATSADGRPLASAAPASPGRDSVLATGPSPAWPPARMRT